MLLGELEPVAVRVEDVDQPHRPVQLEHGADLDARLGQPLALGLDVVDVDRRDRAFLLGHLGDLAESDLGRCRDRGSPSAPARPRRSR